MMKISTIERRRGDARRVDIHVDGTPRLSVAKEVLLRAGLGVGDEISEARIAELERDDLRWGARESSLNLLSHRARSARELRGRLLRKRFPAAVVDECISDLADRGLVDDAAFAESFVRDRLRFNPRAPRHLIQELRAKGVDPDIASSAVAAAMADDDTSELDLARQIAARWAPRSGEDTARARRRLEGLLGRRGFGVDTVRRILSELD